MGSLADLFSPGSFASQIQAMYSNPQINTITPQSQLQGGGVDMNEAAATGAANQSQIYNQPRNPYMMAPIQSSAGLQPQVGNTPVGPTGLGTSSNPLAAPTYSTQGLGIAGSQAGPVDPALRATMSSGNQGYMMSGLGAFTGDLSDLYTSSGGSGNVENTGGNAGGMQVNQDAMALNGLKQFAAQNGIGLNMNDPNQVQQVTQAMNNKLGNFYQIGGLSGGWDGQNGGGKSSADTMYYNNGQGSLVPVSNPTFYTSQNQGGFFKQPFGQGLLTAASLLAPAAGGLAGIAASAAPETTAAVQGAIGTNLTNGLLNGVGNWALSGGQGGAKSLLGSLGTSSLGSLGSAAGNSIMGGNGLGNLFSSAGTIGQTPMQSFNKLAGGLGGGAFGTGANFLSGLGGGGINASSLATGAAGAAGSYVGKQINPQLSGAGGQTAQGLMSMFLR